MNKVLAPFVTNAIITPMGAIRPIPTPPPLPRFNIQHQQLKTPHLRSWHTGGTRISLRFETKSEH